MESVQHSLTDPKREMLLRCFQKHNLTKARLSDSLNGRRWRFLNGSPDDFRAGLPCLSHKVLPQPTKGPVPILLHTRPEAPHQTQPGSKRMVSEPQSRTSKLSRLQQARKETVAQTEYCLSRHPLALYPHLAESIPLELFREVVGILDPEMLSEEEEADLERGGLAPSASQLPLESKRKRKTKPKKSHKGKDLKSKGPYTWFSKQEVAAREREARLHYVPPLDDSVKEALKEFCRGLDSLGGEKHTVDEAAILNLFDVHYETKLPMLVPVQVVEPNDLPAELRRGVGTPPAQDGSLAVPGSQSKDRPRPKRERVRYGAWYLDPKTWKKQKASEPLEDPQVEDGSIENTRKILAEKDADIMQLHGTHAFKEYLERKGYRIPEFLQQMLAVQNSLGSKTRAAKGSRNKFPRHKELQEDSSSMDALG